MNAAAEALTVPARAAWFSMTALALWMLVILGFGIVHAEAITGLLRLWDHSPMYSVRLPGPAG